MADQQKIVVVGNGMAGARFLEEMIRCGIDDYDISIFGAENYGNYNRILLSSLLSGEKDIDDIMLNGDSWYEEHHIRFHKGISINKINTGQKTISASNGEIYQYDKLVIATGSFPFILPIPGNELDGVMTFRDIQDVQNMLDISGKYKKAVVIGGGLLGLESAYGLHMQGMDVTVVHLSDTLMNRQLDSVAAELLQSSLTKRGLKVITNASTKEIMGEHRVKAVSLEDDQEIEADLVVMAAGITPNILLAQQSGVACDKGIKVNDFLQTSDSSIYAIGECIEHRGTCYGLVAPLYEQAKILAQHLCGLETTGYAGSPVSTNLKVTGINLFSAGNFLGDADSEIIELRDHEQDIYKKLVIKDDRLQGVILYGDVIACNWYFDLICKQENITAYRDFLVFGEACLESDAIKVAA